MQPQHRVNVFISSTERDLFSYRNAAIGGIIQAGMFPVLRESFTATSNDPLTVSKEMIDQAEIFIGIYALKYGGSPPGLQISWTEAEYDYAFSKKKLFLIFFLHSSQHANWPQEATDTGTLAQKLVNFKDKLAQNHMYNFFNNEDDLYSKVSEYLRRPPYSKIGEGRMVYEPVFGLPKAHSQYNADVFMVMPFREDLRPVYDDHIKKTIGKLGLSIKRGDDFFTTDAIVGDIWAATNNAQLVIADCTGKNPNVFYELGIAHTIGRKTIAIAQSETDIPFDIRHYRYVTYEYTPDGMAKFELELEEAIKKILDIP
ncbi:MAG: DUF4062 domain-containing protein [Anaerolineae bacterium]|nr:DUF4062 domain-containing protein [Anaerolineae bacterium]